MFRKKWGRRVFPYTVFFGLVPHFGLTSSPPKARSWKKEIEDEERNHRAERLAQDAQRREARVFEATKRGERYVLYANTHHVGAGMASPE